MTCKEAQEAVLLTPEMEAPELARHLADCACCRRFAAFHRVVLSQAPGDVPGEDIDAAVLEVARSRLDRRRRGWRVLWPRVAAVAAAVATVLGIWGLVGTRSAGDADAVMAAAPSDEHIAWNRSFTDLESELLCLEVDMALTAAGADGLPHADAAAVPREDSVPVRPTIEDALLRLEVELYLEMEHVSSFADSSRG